jgi:tryptophan-rich sensory protein
MDGEWTFWFCLAGSALAAIATAGIGGFLTATGEWYQQLRVPAWKPPDWAFGPIWTAILAMATFGAAEGLVAAPDGASWWRLIAALVTNCVFNILWNGLFFSLRRPDWALVEVFALWLSILAVILVLWSISPQAAWLWVPYLAWVSIAAALNWKIVILNRPFGTVRDA